MHFVPLRLPGFESGRFPVAITGEVLREPESWATEQTRRRRLEMLGEIPKAIHVGGAKRWRRRDIERLIESKRK